MRILVRVASGVCAVVLFALAMWFTNVKPHLDGKLQNPLITKGLIGAVVRNRAFSVKVTRVDAADGILQDGQRASTPGVFVIVYLTARATTKPVGLGHARLLTRDGSAYDEAGRSNVFSLTKALQPLLWQPAHFVFEIPKDRLAGAQFLVGEDTLIDNLSAETQVDLGLGGATTTRLLANPPASYVLKPN